MPTAGRGARIVARLGQRLGPSFRRRLLQTPIVLLVLVTASFFMVRLAPGGPFLGEKEIPPETREAIEAHFGLDDPLPVQYLGYVGGLLVGDLGPSYHQRGQSVNEIIATYLPISVMLGAIALLLALAVGIAAGTLAAVRRNSWRDHLVMTLVMLGVSIPAFVIAPLLQLCFGVWIELFPIAEYKGWSHPEYLVLPALTLAAPFAARFAGLVRAGLLEVLDQDFLRTARAKGLSNSRILIRHALPGGLLPVLGFLGPAVASILTGSLVVEKIFVLPGLGKEFVTSALNRDYTLVLGTVVVYGTVLVVANILADVLHALLDPRVDHG